MQNGITSGKEMEIYSVVYFDDDSSGKGHAENTSERLMVLDDLLPEEIEMLMQRHPGSVLVGDVVLVDEEEIGIN